MGSIGTWRPSWWSEQVHGSAWERVREAMRRDWVQTKHDVGLKGHEMNQDLSDTLKQAAGKEHLPTINEANPPRVIGEWTEAETPYRYGYAARKQWGGDNPQWNADTEAKLGVEWMAAADLTDYGWSLAKPFVRRGFEYREEPR
jgi:hypothetical protein